jgi:preprotein translocase subunit YajC
MKVSAISFTPLILFGVFSLNALAQDANPSQDQKQSVPQRGQRGERGAWGGGVMGRAVMGTVTEVTADHFTIKTDAGETYTIHYSVNTRIMKGGGRQRRDDNDIPSTPPIAIKASDIKVGDAIGATGEMDAAAKSVGAIVIFQIDPERAKQMREMQANYGKTWIMGRVTAINDVKVTLQGGPDNAAHTFVADENTTFRKRRDPITLADIQVGDMVRAEGSVRSGAFLATSVAVMGPPPQRAERATPPPQ